MINFINFPKFALHSVVAFAALLLVWCGSIVSRSPQVNAAEGRVIPPASKKKIVFTKDIQPLLKEHCYRCHGPSKSEARLRLDRKDDALNGGDSGPAFQAGKSEESLLIKMVAGVDPDVLMPPEGEKLTDDQIGLLRAWIDQGIDWPKE